MSVVKIELNGIEFGYTGTDIILTGAVKGLALPTPRTSSGNFSGRDGGYISAQFMPSREIVIEGVAYGTTPLESEQRFGQMTQAVMIRQLLPFYITTSSGQRYYTQVQTIDMQFDLTHDRLHKFELTLLAPDPSFFIVNPDDENDGWNSEVLEPVTGGGYITPFVLPVEWDDSSQITIINNTTTSVAYPQIILNGMFVNPIIRNLTTGEQIGLNITTTAGDVVVIDISDRTITLNGGSILPSMTGTWWGLVQGVNNIELAVDSMAPDADGELRYRLPYLSIFEGA